MQFMEDHKYKYTETPSDKYEYSPSLIIHDNTNTQRHPATQVRMQPISDHKYKYTETPSDTNTNTIIVLQLMEDHKYNT